MQKHNNPYLQYFCGYPGYDDERLPFDPSLMVYFRKRLTPEVLGEINEMILRDTKERQKKEAVHACHVDFGEPTKDTAYPFALAFADFALFVLSAKTGVCSVDINLSVILHSKLLTIL